MLKGILFSPVHLAKNEFCLLFTGQEISVASTESVVSGPGGKNLI